MSVHANKEKAAYGQQKRLAQSYWCRRDHIGYVVSGCSIKLKMQTRRWLRFDQEVDTTTHTIVRPESTYRRFAMHVEGETILEQVFLWRQTRVEEGNEQNGQHCREQFTNL